jgi:hypothetical protein
MMQGEHTSFVVGAEFEVLTVLLLTIQILGCDAVSLGKNCLMF